MSEQEPESSQTPESQNVQRAMLPRIVVPVVASMSRLILLEVEGCFRCARIIGLKTEIAELVGNSFRAGTVAVVSKRL